MSVDTEYRMERDIEHFVELSEHFNIRNERSIKESAKKAMLRKSVMVIHNHKKIKEIADECQRQAGGEPGILIIVEKVKDLSTFNVYNMETKWEPLGSPAQDWMKKTEFRNFTEDQMGTGSFRLLLKMMMDWGSYSQTLYMPIMYHEPPRNSVVARPFFGPQVKVVNN